MGGDDTVPRSEPGAAIVHAESTATEMALYAGFWSRAKVLRNFATLGAATAMQ